MYTRALHSEQASDGGCLHIHHRVRKSSSFHARFTDVITISVYPSAPNSTAANAVVHASGGKASCSGGLCGCPVATDGPNGSWRLLIWP